MKKLILTLILLCSQLPAEEDPGEVQDPFLLDGEAEPSAIVNGVNTITGAYTFSDANLFINDADPLIFAPSYNSRSDGKGNLTKNFHHNFPTKLERIKDPENPLSQMVVDMPGGSCLHYYGDPSIDRTEYYLSQELLKHGLTNCGGGPDLRANQPQKHGPQSRKKRTKPTRGTSVEGMDPSNITTPITASKSKKDQAVIASITPTIWITNSQKSESRTAMMPLPSGTSNSATLEMQ